MYLLTEQIMNGTVTMSLVTTGISAETFDEAKDKVRNMRNMHLATIHEDTNERLTYTIPGKFPCWGVLENKVLTVM